MPSRRNAVADRFRDPLGVPAVPPPSMSPSGRIALVVIPETEAGREMLIDLPKVASETGARSAAELAVVVRYDPINDETEYAIAGGRASA